MAGEQVISSIMRFKQPDGSFVAVFPINTTNDVYYDIDKGITLADILKDGTSSIEINTYTIDDI